MKKTFFLFCVIAFIVSVILFLRARRQVEPSPVLPREEVRVTLIEGWTVDDMGLEVAKNHGVSASDVARLYGRSSDRSPFAPELRSAFPFLAVLPPKRSLEGYAFPDTYRVWKDELPEALMKKQLQTFSERYGSATITSASAPLKSLDEVVRLASIVEKEVRGAEDRRLVAGIFLRRLRIGMGLQSDATLNYVLDSGRARATASDLALDSPYNTYKYRGLPPGPISNPGATALDAVLHPTRSSYLYFLTDRKGNVLYARTFEEHQANRRKAGY